MPEGSANTSAADLERQGGDGTVFVEGRGAFEQPMPGLEGADRRAFVNRHTRFLHDGRARDLTEAILWHGGEAAGAQQRFRALSAEDRERLVGFLDSL